MEDAMKKSLVVSFALVAMILGLAAAATAGSAPRMKVDIPFDFYLGDQMLPAGEYLIEMPNLMMASPTGSFVVVRNEDGSVYHCLHANTGEYARGFAWQVTFHKYGETYFFAKVQNSSFVSTLPKTRAEKEMSVKTAAGPRGASKDVVVASSNQE
jgi:hypothetical protein